MDYPIVGDYKGADAKSKKKGDRWAIMAKPYERDKYITPEEFEKQLLPAAAKLTDKRTWMLLYVIGNLGLRVSEAIFLRARDVHPVDPVVFIRTLKQRHYVEDKLPVSEPVVARLRSWIVEHELKPEDRFFPYSRQWAKRMFDRVAMTAGLKIWGNGKSTKGRGIHSLRHMYGLALAERCTKGSNFSPIEALMFIRGQMRHQALKSTLVYLHMHRKREAVNSIGELGGPAPTPPEAPPAAAPAAPPATPPATPSAPTTS